MLSDVRQTARTSHRKKYFAPDKHREISVDAGAEGHKVISLALISSPHVMGHFSRSHHRYLDDAANLAVFLPCCLVDDFMHAMLFDGVGIAATSGKDVADDFA